MAGGLGASKHLCLADGGSASRGWGSVVAFRKTRATHQRGCWSSSVCLKKLVRDGVGAKSRQSLRGTRAALIAVLSPTLVSFAKRPAGLKTRLTWTENWGE
ncbi:hypothetical protein BO78DRAFT_102000 [Aspergillus sclerotiicarbonarius CBS 121057]|uniref:Uncharacterized protein n=1 Tax=Aspergillus sclerotiicarbonarius (strain CBS 121057 / IBT 28362) TaxID=1448318 RepID=A0A319F716_ASPSB|nr:hypothetical protein BO78DRAFT_102000 [Aspergillus sclerotiicarbonarius CBS 121057]